MVISRRKNQWYTVSQLLLEQNIWQAWLLAFLPPKLSVLIKNNILHQSKNYKNHFENSNFWGMWPLGHVGHVTYSFINMLFISMVIFDDKLRPQILSVSTTTNSPLSSLYIQVCSIYILDIRHSKSFGIWSYVVYSEIYLKWTLN
jgi:hypothetical protein